MSPGKPAYHHGDLRRALIEAAVACIAEAGPQTLTLREVARRAGVSHAAPYRHFPDKESLVAAVAEEGFAALGLALDDAAARGRSPRARLERAGLAYVDFAVRRPAHFRVMFDRPDGSPRAPDAGRLCFEQLEALVDACRESGDLRSDDLTAMTRTAWSSVHGVAQLAIQGMLGPSAPEQARRLARYAMRATLDGLGA